MAAGNKSRDGKDPVKRFTAMSSPPTSTAAYIIICSRRIDALMTDDPKEKIKAASDCAAQLVTYLAVRLGYKLTGAHTKAISDLQHEMMERLNELKKEEADAKVAEMFDLCDALEKQFGGY